MSDFVNSSDSRVTILDRPAPTDYSDGVARWRLRTREHDILQLHPNGDIYAGDGNSAPTLHSGGGGGDTAEEISTNSASWDIILGDDVQAALDAIDTYFTYVTGVLDIHSNAIGGNTAAINDHITDTSGAHAATAISASASGYDVLSGGTVQAQLSSADDALAARPNVILDTAANLSSDNPVLLEGQIAHETTTDTFRIGNGSDNYNDLPVFEPAANIELDYADSTTGQSTTSSSFADVSGLTVTFTVTSRPVYVTAVLPFLSCTASGTVAQFALTDQNDNDVQLSGYTFVANGQATQFVIERRFSTPGEYTIRLRFRRSSGSGTISNNFDVAGIVSHIKAIQT